LPQERHAAQPGPLDRRAAVAAAGGEADPQTAAVTVLHCLFLPKEVIYE